MTVINQTNDYSIFKKNFLNRDIKKSHLRNLEKIILNNNYLAIHPISCNENMEIIDGQHRFEIARKNNLTIFYTKSNISDYHILDANLYQKKLSIKEVINFYAAKEKKEDYLTLQNYMGVLNLNIRSLLALIFGIASSHFINLIKTGNFILPPTTENFDKICSYYLEIISFAEKRRITPLSMLRHFNFCIAFRNICLNDNFDFKLFINKLENKWFNLRPQINHEGWYQLLIEIYNWKNQQPL